MVLRLIIRIDFVDVWWVGGGGGGSSGWDFGELMP